MKKRVIIGIIVVLVLAAVIALTAKKQQPDEAASTTTSAASQQETTEDNTPELQNGTKNPDKLVKVTLPLSFYDAVKKADTSGFINKGNYEKIDINEKQKTFTVTMRSITYDFMLSNVGIQVIKNIVTLLDNKDYPYIKSLGDYNSDFSEIELIVDEKEYGKAKNTGEIGPFVANCGVFYQIYSTENSYSCKVVIRGEKNNSVLDEYSAQFNNSNLG